MWKKLREEKLSIQEKKYLNIDRSDLKENEDAPRMHYNIYKDVPLEKWENGFIEYAIDDAIGAPFFFSISNFFIML